MSPATPYPGNPPLVKKLFNWILVLAAMVGAFYGVGVIVPRSQKLGSLTTTAANPMQLYEVVADPTTWSDWHPDFTSVTELEKKKDERRWRVIDVQGQIFELTESQADEGLRWQGSYERLGTRTTLRFEFTGFGSGARLRLVKTVDTRDPWLRAKRFLWFGDDSSSLTILNALQGFVGEAPAAVKDND